MILQIFDGVGLRERTAEHREILREDVHQPPVHAAVAGDESVSRRPLLLHAEIRALVRDELVQLLERSFVQQQRDPFARRELARRLLARPAFGASAGFRRGFAPPQLFDLLARYFRNGHTPRPSRRAGILPQRRSDGFSVWSRLSAARPVVGQHDRVARIGGIILDAGRPAGNQPLLVGAAFADG